MKNWKICQKQELDAGGAAEYRIRETFRSDDDTKCP